MEGLDLASELLDDLERFWEAGWYCNFLVRLILIRLQSFLPTIWELVEVIGFKLHDEG